MPTVPLRFLKSMKVVKGLSYRIEWDLNLNLNFVYQLDIIMIRQRSAARHKIKKLRKIGSVSYPMGIAVFDI